MVKPTFSYIVNRLQEPSTLAGLGILAALFGAPQEKISAVTQIIMGLAGGLAVLLPEKKA